MTEQKGHWVTMGLLPTVTGEQGVHRLLDPEQYAEYQRDPSAYKAREMAAAKQQHESRHH
jgi:hypothetical protein